jgi:hypothetical protein
VSRSRSRGPGPADVDGTICSIDSRCHYPLYTWHLLLALLLDLDLGFVGF